MQSNEPNDSFSRWTDRSKEFDFINSPVLTVDNQYCYNTILMQWEVLHHDHLDQTQDDLYPIESFVSPGFIETPTHTPIGSIEELTDQDDLDGSDTSVSVSTAFYPGAYNESYDTVFSTADAVLFYVHSKIIMDASTHPFRSLLGAPLSDPRFRDHVISLSESSNALNIILHMLYGTSSAQYSPTFETLVIAVDQMPTYDIQPCAHIIPPTPLYNLLLSHAPFSPIELYSLAAHHSLDALAVNTSSHLLSYSICTLSDELAGRMGAVYLKRLLLLHLERFNALKEILLRPPSPHPPTKDCDFHDQKRLTRAWALAVAYLAFDAKPDLSTYRVRSSLAPLTEEVGCELCLRTLKDRIQNVIAEWASVKVTI